MVPGGSARPRSTRALIAADQYRLASISAVLVANLTSEPGTQYAMSASCVWLTASARFAKHFIPPRADKRHRALSEMPHELEPPIHVSLSLSTTLSDNDTDDGCGCCTRGCVFAGNFPATSLDHRHACWSNSGRRSRRFAQGYATPYPKRAV
jgi:hypothetical protein